jgi:hypothetical protein
MRTLFRAVGVLACSAAMTAMAAQPSPGPGGRGGRPGMMPGGPGRGPASPIGATADFLLAHTGDLALTDAQVVKLAAISRRTDARRKAMEARFDSARAANRPTPDDTTRPRRPAGPPPDDMQRTRDQARADIRDAIAVLTPDQQATAWMMIAGGGGPPLGAAFAGPMTPGRERGFGEGGHPGAGRQPIDRPPPPRDVPRRPEGSDRTEP